VTVHSALPRKALPRPHRVVCAGRGLAFHQPDPPEAYYVIENGTDPQAFAPRGVGGQTRAALGLPRDAFVIGTAARLTEDKISRRMADGYLELLRHDRRMHLLLVGSGPTGEYLRRRAQEMGCGDRLRLPGAVNNVADYLEALDLCAHAVEEEPFGIAILEAMANGLPIVSARLCGPMDTVEDGVCGFLCDSVGQFITRVLECARGEHDLATMSLNAIRRARTFDERRTALKYKLVYDEVANGAKYWWPPRTAPGTDHVSGEAALEVSAPTQQL
jgi:glycosyltransferase involved in cell wall biosynthesis